jgi:hypothetical protein
MIGVKGLLVALLAFAGLSTACHAVDPCAGVDRTRQLESLRTVYYRSGQLPSDPSQAELAELRRLKALPDLQEQTALLEKAFPNDERLQAIAARDRDGDGIKDYRITRCGEFRENDPDADCDGIPNVLDDSPYDGVATPGQSCAAEPDWHRVTDDRNGNGLPDYLDWRMLNASGGSKRPAEVQEGLFRDYGILLVDRRTRMPATVAVELDHVIRDVFPGQVTPDFAPLRVITTDRSVCGDGDTYGWASPENSTVFFMPATLKLSPVMRLEIFAHELTHTVQYAMDFSPADVLGYRMQNRYESSHFLDFATSLGWTVVTPAPSRQPYALAVWQCAGDDASPELAYLGRPAKYWQGAFTTAEQQAEHMVDSYAFSDAWEWGAEYNAAFVLNELLHAAGRICTLSEAASLRRRLSADMRTEWDYHHEYAIGLPAYESVIPRQFHVDDDTWDALARRFLLASYPGICE